MILSPAEQSTLLQENFVKTELETGHRMLKLAVEQRDRDEHESAMESLTLARVALSGAEEHLAAVKLPPHETREILPEVRRLRNQIENFERGADGRQPNNAQKIHSDSGGE
jgi:hypothetical protein